MKKLAGLFMLTALLVSNAYAQTINVTGTVKTSDGDALHLAFVQDQQFKNGAFTDSLGNFALSADANSKLHITCRGFRDTLFSVNNRTNFSIVLRPLVNIVASRSNIPAVVDPNNNINIATLRDEVFLREPAVPNDARVYADARIKYDKNYKPTTLSSGGVLDAAQGAIFPVFTHKEETKGSRYFFNTWVHGYVVNTKDSLIQHPDFYFNYDKMSGDLLLTKDKVAAIALYKDKLKSVTLFDELNQPHIFTLVPEIDKTHYVQVIAEGGTYSIYKLTKTKFVPANHSSDGIASTGNYYDEFEDDDSYFVVYVKTNQVQKLSLRKKAIKQVFAADENKVTAYLKSNDGDIDDNYLHDFGDYMNK